MQYYVYILSSFTKTLYIGVTNNLIRRVYEHKNQLLEGIASQYNIDQLAYYEITEDITTAITREKQLKKWSRAKKINLIESVNPDWNDLYSEIIK
jgi:putative endonuclease